jgi:hypothetical protein
MAKCALALPSGDRVHPHGVPMLREASRHAPLLVAAIAGACLVACGSDSSTTASTTSSGAVSGVPPPAPSFSPAPLPSASTLPFHFDGAGQGGSPPFSVATAGDQKVAWTAAGVSGSPACTVSIGLSGPASSFTVVDGVQVGPTDTKNGSKTLHLEAGTYRAVEGGGCSWSITVGG